jgi:MFS family permease
MWAFLAGRLLQGLGAGGQTVALYVVVARVYPPRLHGRLFAAFSATWVIPSFVGPFAAGAVAQYVHWRWVFLGVAVLTAGAFILVFMRLHGRPLGTDEPSTDRIGPRVWLAVAVAAGVLGLSLSDQLKAWTLPAVTASIVVLLLAVLPLVPRGTLRAGRGLPSVVLMRGLIAGALFGSEVYLPYLLVTEYGFSVTWAGLALTVSAIAWAIGSGLQGRFGDRLGNVRISVIGVAMLASATALATATALGHLPPAIAIAGWSLAGGGMGLMYPRMTVLTLAYSTPQNQGFNSSALSIFDAAGSATTIAIMGLVFTALQATDAGFAVVFGLAALLALLALIPGLRLGHAHET